MKVKIYITLTVIISALICCILLSSWTTLKWEYNTAKSDRRVTCDPDYAKHMEQYIASRAYNIKYKGHDYIYFYKLDIVVHDPDCKCTNQNK
jgi:hypothetical protein